MKTRRGYTLVETLIALTILLIGIAAAASMAMTMASYEEASTRAARALNIQEQAGRLYQLGLAPSDITAILPAESGVVALTFTTSTVALANIGNMDYANCQLIFTTGTALTSSAYTQRINNIVLVRPSIR